MDTSRHRQRAFIHACALGDKTMPQIMKEQKLDACILGRWLNQQWFQARINEVQRAFAKTRRLELQMSALLASRRLSEVSQRSLKRQHISAAELREIRGASVDLIRLAREKRRPRVEVNTTDPSPAASLFHPQVPSAQAEALIREMSATRS